MRSLKPLKLKRSGCGFTVGEMLISVSILVLLSALLIGYSRTSEKQLIFYREQTFLLNNLLKTKSFAIQSYQPPAMGSEVVCGWGIHFEENLNQYLIFHDLAPGGAGGGGGGGPGIPDPCVSADGSFSRVPTSEEFETFILDPAVTIECVEVFDSPGGTCTGTGALDLDVVFLPPDPLVIFSPGVPSDREAVIVLSLVGLNRTSTIRVNWLGQISLD